MPAPARFRPVCTTLRKHRPKRDLPTLMVTVRDRLILEALKSHENDDLTLEQVGQVVDQAPPIYTTSATARSSGTVIPLDYPWWYGGLAKDRPVTPATESQCAALARARQRKIERQLFGRSADHERQAQIEKPYVKDEDEVPG